jgi:protein-tyrosine-phosphatase
MVHTQPSILVVGGADTGRAPMTVALLRRLLSQASLEWHVASAGVTGHDNEPAELEARDAMLTLGLDISEHRARSLSDELVAEATILLTLDKGTARVVQARYPDAAERVVTLGELAVRSRDIPDPFRMQVGAWVSYAHEIDELLRLGLDRLLARMRGEALPEPPPAHETASHAEAPEAPAASLPAAALEDSTQREAAVERCTGLLRMLRDMPEVVDWSPARQRLAEELQAASDISLQPGDMAQAYVAMLRALLDMQQTPPNAARCQTLHDAVEHLRHPIDQQAITDVSRMLAGWSGSPS